MCKWISVDERLPDKNGQYLTCRLLMENLYGEDIRVIDLTSFAICPESLDPCELRGEKDPSWFDYDVDYGYWLIDDITHWMPCPELPWADRTKEGE